MGFPRRDEIKNKKKYLIDGLDRTPSVNVTETERSFIWVRIYLKKEYDIKKGSEISIIYKNREELKTIFSTYEKKNLNKDKGEQVTEFTTEEDKKTLCVMVDLNDINNPEKNKDIPFLKTLFKAGRFYEHQILKKGDLSVMIENDKKLDFHTIQFNN